MAAGENYFPIQSLVGMSAYDSEAMLIGRIKEVGLRRTGRTAQITIKIGEKEVPWDGISKIGDIVLLKTAQTQTTTASTAGGMCPACGFENESDSVFCADCGSRL